MKSYLRYSPERTFGVISSECNAIYDFSGKLAITGAIQDVGVWNIRQSTMIQSLQYEVPSYPYGEFGEVTVIGRCPDKKSIIAGYSTGELRLFNIQTGALITTFRGHRASITSIAFDDEKNGSYFASGSKDSDVIVWDLISSTGIARFHEHKDSITSLLFYTKKNGEKLIISGSKDTLIKVLDLESRACIQTIVGHRSEIWSLTFSQNDHDDEKSYRLYTGCADEFVRVYKIKTEEDKKKDNKKEDVSEEGEGEFFTYFGMFERQSANDRVASISVNPSNTLLAVQTSGKSIDLFKIRSQAESKKKMKRRVKRLKNKNEKEQEGNEKDDEKDDGITGEIIVADEIEFYYTIRLGVKARSFCFNPIPPSPSEDTALVALSSNSLEIYKIPHGIEGEIPSKLSVLDLFGHRSDVRSLTISPDGNNLASSSFETIKVWSTRNNQPTSTFQLEGQCLCLAYAPGGRFILAGFKDGTLSIFDTSSGDVIFTDREAHQGNAIWSIYIRPDGRGFLTGSADKTIKLWNFIIGENSNLSGEYDREIVLPSDVLAVQYNNTKTTNSLFIAAGLLDNTVRVFYEDSLKLFLTLYGHKLPVLALDISYDSTILVSGSADKTIKIWGLDFGDCHRSLHAHEDSVTSIKFQPLTHYFFSSSKDGSIKYWDADRFEQILYLPGHKGSLWSLSISPEGDSLYSCGQDRSIRVWKRTEDLVFIEEEKERQLEAQVDKEAAASGSSASEGSLNLEMITTKSVESIKSSEQLMAAIDLVEEEIVLEEERKRAFKSLKTEEEKKKFEKQQKKSANVLLLNLSPYQYLLRSLRTIKHSELESTLILLPFHYVKKFLKLLIQLIRQGLDIELCSRISILLLRNFQLQILSTQLFLPELIELKTLLSSSIHSYRDLIGTNIAGIQYLIRVKKEEEEESLAFSNVQKGPKSDDIKKDMLDLNKGIIQLADINNKNKKPRLN